VAGEDLGVQVVAVVAELPLDDAALREVAVLVVVARGVLAAAVHAEIAGAVVAVGAVGRGEADGPAAAAGGAAARARRAAAGAGGAAEELLLDELEELLEPPLFDELDELEPPLFDELDELLDPPLPPPAPVPPLVKSSGSPMSSEARPQAPSRATAPTRAQSRPVPAPSLARKRWGVPVSGWSGERFIDMGPRGHSLAQVKHRAATVLPRGWP
jgi:hypothetical protein